MQDGKAPYVSVVGAVGKVVNIMMVKDKIAQDWMVSLGDVYLCHVKVPYSFRVASLALVALL